MHIVVILLIQRWRIHGVPDRRQIRQWTRITWYRDLNGVCVVLWGINAETERRKREQTSTTLGEQVMGPYLIPGNLATHVDDRDRTSCTELSRWFDDIWWWTLLILWAFEIFLWTVGLNVKGECVFRWLDSSCNLEKRNTLRTRTESGSSLPVDIYLVLLA